MNKKGIYKKMLTLAVVPILLFGIALTIFCYIRFKETLYNTTKTNMADMAHYIIITYDKTYPGDYTLVPNSSGTYDVFKGDENITYDYSIVDAYARETDTEVSYLYMDVRVHTTFKTETGKRYSGISANEETSAMVIGNGAEAFYKNVPILGKEYLVYYAPIRGRYGRGCQKNNRNKEESYARRMAHAPSCYTRYGACCFLFLWIHQRRYQYIKEDSGFPRTYRRR